MKKKQQNLIAIVIGTIFAIFLYFNFFLLPVNKKISEKRRTIQELTDIIANAKKESRQLDYLKQKVVILDSQVKELQERLPKQKDFPDLLRRFSRIAQKCGIKIKNLQPLSLNSATAGEYNELPYSIQFVGSFHTLGNFLSEIGQEKRLMSSRDLKITAMDSTDKKTTISGSFTLVAFLAKG